MEQGLQLVKGDVTIEEDLRDCEECTGTITGQPFRVAVDFRSAGQVSYIAHDLHEECAKKLAARIQAGLPEGEGA